MSKIIPSKISKNKREKLRKLLSAKIAKLSSAKAADDFLEDLLTESELIMITRRLQIAKLLLDGFLYWEIRKELGVAYDTIRTVRARLDRGKGGYLNFIKGLKI